MRERVPLPGSAEFAWQTAERFRREARRRRRTSRLIGWCFALVLLGGVGGAGYAAYVTFQDDRELAASNGGVAGALGGAIDSVDGLHRHTLSNGMPVTAELALVEIGVDDVFPTFVRGAARDLGPVDGMQRYAVNVGDLADLQPVLTSDWLAVLGALPQSPAAIAGWAAPGEGELMLGIATDGDAVRRLVVSSAEPWLSIDTTS